MYLNIIECSEMFKIIDLQVFDEGKIGFKIL